MLKKSILGLSIALICRAQSPAGQGPVYKLIYSPQSGSNLGQLYNIFEAKPGLFYILSENEGNLFGASIFSLTSTGSAKTIYTFPPYNTITVVQATNEELYGAGAQSASPQYFYYSMDPTGKNLKTYPFQGAWGSAFATTVAPNAIYDLAGELVGQVVTYGFARLSESGKISILHQFSSSEGVPFGSTPLIFGPDGNFYDIGNQVPSGNGQMFIYRFTPSGTYSRLLNFASIPGYDAFPLVAASDGNLYGSFSKGGVDNAGEIYQVTLSGQFQVVASLPKAVSSPRTLMQAADGNLYGTTVYNQIFRYDMTTHAVSLVYQMNAGGAQGHCPCVLVEGMDGKLYGAAPNGGNFPGQGAVFSLDIGLPKPLPSVSGLYPAFGKVGQKVLLWGNYLLGATSVSFNGTPATGVKSTSVQSVAATVPAGATTGPVTVTTANGSFTTTQNFTVQ